MPTKRRVTKVPRTRKPPKNQANRPSLDVTGLSLSDLETLLNSPTARKLTKGDLDAILRRLRSAANKRLKRLEQSGATNTSQAYQKRRAKRKGKLVGKARRWKAKKKQSHRQKTNEIEEILRWMKYKTSHVKGAKEVMRKITEDIGEFPTTEDANQFWETYHRLLEEYPLIRDKNDAFYMSLRKKLYQRMFDKDKPAKTPLEDVMEEMRSIIEEELQSRQGDLDDSNEEIFQDIEDEENEDEEFNIEVKEERVRIFDDEVYDS